MTVSPGARQATPDGPRRSTRPGRAPVCRPSFTTSTPLTIVVEMPAGYWWGSSKVARSMIVAGSKTVTSAR
jgi:hypothetical protein